MSILAPGSDWHCPECGTSNLADMWMTAGNPYSCIECRVDVVEDCGIDCEHLWTTWCGHPDFDDIEADMAPLVALFASDAPTF